jgi:hypothetical protein
MKIEGDGKLASVRRWFRTVAIDVCLIFNEAVVFSSKYSVSCLYSSIYRRLALK